MMEWIMAKKSDKETTLDDFNDLMKTQFENRVKKGGVGMVTAFHIKQTGLAAYGKESEVAD